MKKEVSTRFCIENEGLRDLEKAYIKLIVDNEAVKIFTLEEYMDDNLDLWDFLESLGYDLDGLEDGIEYDPFVQLYYQLMEKD